ncbi:MAG: hypothetical protein OXG83_06970 [Acidobacteria bacterium]|nr:hypothetical protein [Acidobacteriota bacterium]
MKRWMERVPGPLRMPLIWAAAGALVGALIEITDNVAPGALAIAPLVDIWPPVLAILGLLGGGVFSVVLWLSRMRSG